MNDPLAPSSLSATAPVETCPKGTGVSIAYGRECRHTSIFSKSTKNSRDTVAQYAALVGFFAVLWLLASTGASKWLYLVLAIAVAGAMVWIRNFVLRPKPVELAALGDIPEFPDINARIACVGDRWKLVRLARRGKIDNHAFEPLAFRGAVTQLSFGGRRWWAFAFFVICFAAMLVIDHLIGWRVALFWLFSPAAAGSVLMDAATWPTYARVVPGRVDVLRFNALGRDVVGIEKFDLRTSAVLVDLSQRCVFLAIDGITTEIGFGAVRDPYEFAHAVLQAAVSTHTPAPLPDDALVG